jgi:hypothetical protein
MKRSGRIALLFLAVLAAAVHGQDIPRPARPRVVVPTPEPARVYAVPGVAPLAPGYGFGSVEAILREKDELKLTDQQVAQLETIRKEEVARRQAESREQIDLESRYQAGLLDRTAWRDEMEKRSDARTAAARSVRDRIEKLLTDEQRDQLDERRFRRISPTAPERIRIERDLMEVPRAPRAPRPPREPMGFGFREGTRVPFSRMEVEPRLRIRPELDRRRLERPSLEIPRFEFRRREVPRFEVPEVDAPFIRWQRRGIL